MQSGILLSSFFQVFCSFPLFTIRDFLFVGLNYTLHQKKSMLVFCFFLHLLVAWKKSSCAVRPDPEKHISTRFIYMNSTIVQDAGSFPIIAISLFPATASLFPITACGLSGFFQDFPLNSKPGTVCVYDHAHNGEVWGLRWTETWNTHATVFKTRCQTVLSITFHLHQLTSVRTTVDYPACSTWTLGSSFW